MLFSEYRKALHEGTDKVPKEAIIGRVKSLYDSGKYDITPHHNHDDRGGIEFHAIAVKAKGAVDYEYRKGHSKLKSWHDPEISTLHTPHPEDDFPRTRAVLNPDSGYTQHVQDEKKDGVLFRGMSHEEYHSVMKTGKIQSNGSQNMGKEQEGLTYYSRDPHQAQFYSHSFASSENKATGKHHAYVVAVKDPGTEVKVKGTGEDEVGIPHAIHKDKILRVHVGRAYDASHGSESSRKDYAGFHPSSGSTPSTSVGWKQLDRKNNLSEQTDESMIEHNGQMVHRDNSSGHTIHSSESGIKNFHDWFSGSKTVDEKNRPHVFYHGTSSDFNHFKSGSGNQWGSGHYFMKSPKVASEYSTGDTTGAHSRIAPQGNAGSNVMPVYLKMKNPFVMDEPMTKDTQKKIEKHLGQKLKDHVWSGMKNRDIRQVLHHQFLPSQDDANHILKKSGFDGIREKSDNSIHMVFEPNQIKSSIGNSGKFSKSSNISESYQGEHSAPDHENGMPAHNLSGMFPDDIHTLHDAARHYGDNGGGSMDNESISIIKHVKDKPNRGVKIYRAVPKVLSHDEQVSQLHMEKAHYMRHGKPHNSAQSKLTGSPYYSKITDDYKKLVSNPPAHGTEEKKPTINKGDWVTTSKEYAVEHGKGNLNNKYRILSKTVKASEIFNDGNSIHEWGYHPSVKESTGQSLIDAYLNEVMDIE